MKKRWPLVIGASILTGIIGSMTLHKNRKNQTEDFIQKYIGQWQFTDASNRTHSLSIQPSLEIAIDRHTLPLTVIELTKDQYTLQDQYGYHLIIKNNGEGATLYDEADDFTYKLTETE